MDKNNREFEINQETFREIVKRAYERGTTETQITVDKLMSELIGDSKALIAK